MKYYNYQVTFSEIPDEVTLCINLSNCPIHCPDCHSKFLWEDVGTELTKQELYRLLDANSACTCLCLMGGDADYDGLAKIVGYYCDWTTERGKWMNIAVYSGRKDVQDMIDHGASYWVQMLTYLKVGPYIKELGGLDKETTNQRLYRMSRMKLEGDPDQLLKLAEYKYKDGQIWSIQGFDYTYKFWR